MSIWDTIKGFTRGELYFGKNAWGDPDKMSPWTLCVLSNLRAKIRRLDPNATFIVHCGYELTGHNGKTHQQGIAVDFHINTEIPYHELIGHIQLALQELCVYDFVGLGIYPDWNTPGFHLDTRGFMARWGYVLDREKSTSKKKVYKEVAFDVAKSYVLLYETERAS